MGRSEEVRSYLVLSGDYHTVREICEALSYPVSDSKFVSSILIGCVKKGFASTKPFLCSVSSRKSTGYMYYNPGSTTNACPDPTAAVPKTRSPRQPKSAPIHKAKTAAEIEIERRRELRRKVAQDAQQKFAEYTFLHAKQSAVEHAYSVFKKLTGYNGKDLEEMKISYRKAAMKIHPDHGGDAAVFADLSSAWQIIRQSSV